MEEEKLGSDIEWADIETSANLEALDDLEASADSDASADAGTDEDDETKIIIKKGQLYETYRDGFLDGYICGAYENGMNIQSISERTKQSNEYIVSSLIDLGMIKTLKN